MNQGKKLTVTSILSVAFFFVSTSVFAQYSQTQKNDEKDSPKPVQSQPTSEMKSDDKSKSEQGSDQSDAHGEGPRDDAAGEHSTEKPRNPVPAK